MENPWIWEGGIREINEILRWLHMNLEGLRDKHSGIARNFLFCSSFSSLSGPLPKEICSKGGLFSS